MWAALFGVFLVLHGLIHPAIYAPPTTPDARWDVHRSWALRLAGVSTRAQHTTCVVLSVLSAVAFVVAGMARLAGAGWWGPAAVVAAALSLVLLLGYFHPWLGFGVLLDLGVIAVVVR